MLTRWPDASAYYCGEANPSMPDDRGVDIHGATYTIRLDRFCVIRCPHNAHGGKPHRDIDGAEWWTPEVRGAGT